MNNPNPTTRATAQAAPSYRLAGGMRYSRWCKSVGIPRTTGYRLRTSGRVKVVRCCGRDYISAEEIARFFSTGDSEPETGTE